MALQLILGNAGAGKSHYIFEKIIEEKELANELFEQLRASSGYFKYQPLSTSAEDNSSDRDSRWKININVEIEMDDI